MKKYLHLPTNKTNPNNKKELHTQRNQKIPGHQIPDF